MYTLLSMLIGVYIFLLLIYIPFFQALLFEEIFDQVEKSLNISIEAKRVELKYPLLLDIDSLIVQSEIFQCSVDAFRADARLVSWGKVSSDVKLNDAKWKSKDLDISIDGFKWKEVDVDLLKKELVFEDVQIKSGTIYVYADEAEVNKDEGFDWNIKGSRCVCDNVVLDVSNQIAINVDSLVLIHLWVDLKGQIVNVGRVKGDEVDVDIKSIRNEEASAIWNGDIREILVSRSRLQYEGILFSDIYCEANSIHLGNQVEGEINLLQLEYDGIVIQKANILMEKEQLYGVIATENSELALEAKKNGGVWGGILSGEIGGMDLRNWVKIPENILEQQIHIDIEAQYQNEAIELFHWSLSGLGIELLGKGSLELEKELNAELDFELMWKDLKSKWALDVEKDVISVEAKAGNQLYLKGNYQLDTACGVLELQAIDWNIQDMCINGNMCIEYEKGEMEGYCFINKLDWKGKNFGGECITGCYQSGKFIGHIDIMNAYMSVCSDVLMTSEETRIIGVVDTMLYPEHFSGNFVVNGNWEGDWSGDFRDLYSNGSKLGDLDVELKNTVLSVVSGDFRGRIQGKQWTQISSWLLESKLWGGTPYFKVEVSGGADNVIARYLRQYRIEWNSMYIEIQGGTHIDAKVEIENAGWSGIYSDTLFLESKDGDFRISMNRITADSCKDGNVEIFGQYRDSLELISGSMQNIDLRMFSGIRGISELRGILNVDLHTEVGKRVEYIDTEMRIDSFKYGLIEMSVLKTNVSYRADKSFWGEILSDTTLILNVEGMYYRDNPFVNVSIKQLPLYLANFFLPEDIVKLSGNLTGDFTIRKESGFPDFNGELQLKNTSFDVLGTTFYADKVPILVENGGITFQDFNITAANGSQLKINGDIILFPLNQLNIDLQMKAQDFQLVSVPRRNNMIYGDGYADIELHLMGKPSSLSLSGQAKLLRATNITYVVDDVDVYASTSDGIVQFVSNVKEEPEVISSYTLDGFSAYVLFSVMDGAGVQVTFASNDENRIQLKGGGELFFSVTSRGQNSLVGKYVISGGTVSYTIPIIGLKVFTIAEGSFIEWTGNPENPLLNISAQTIRRVSVQGDGGDTRLVTFNVQIRVEDTPEHPEITFNLTAPNDQIQQAQLASYSPDERSRLALNLLIYGTYDVPGSESSGGNPFGSFVESELNQWSRRYLGDTGLTFGIDSYNRLDETGQEVKRTDYSYQFSRYFFDDRVNIKIGGRLSADNDNTGVRIEQNLVDDISIEYSWKRYNNILFKVFRQTDYENVFDENQIRTGIGLVWRKAFRRFADIFRTKEK